MKHNTSLNCEVYDSIEDIDKTAWDNVEPVATGLKYDVLQAIEYSGINDLVCRYLLFKDDLGAAKAKANLYQVTMDLTTIDRNLNPVTQRVIKKWHPNFLNLSMIECGLFAMNGDGLVSSDSRLLGRVIEQTTTQ